MSGNEPLAFLSVQPVFPYFLKVKLGTLGDVTRDALREGFKNYYQGLADYYKQLMDYKNPEERKIGLLICKREYENLFNALKICLERQDNISIFFCMSRYLRRIHDLQGGLELAKAVCQSLENYPLINTESKLVQQQAMVVGELGNYHRETKQYQQAQQSYQQALAMLQVLKSEDESERQLWIANIYHKLGIVAQELREFEEARRNYQQALEIAIEFGDRYSPASIYHQLGRVALEIKIGLGDYYNQSLTYNQLGRVAQYLGEFEEAQRNYQQALEIYIEYGDRYSQAGTYQNLGLLAEVQEDYAEARANLQKALEIWIEYKDEYWGAIAREALERLPVQGRGDAEKGV